MLRGPQIWVCVNLQIITRDMFDRNEHGKPSQCHEQAGGEVGADQVVGQLALQLEFHHYAGIGAWNRIHEKTLA